MDLNRNKNGMGKGIYILLAGLIPLVTMIGVMIVCHVQPFGDNSMIIIDGLHQYMPFFSILYDKLKSGESLFYSFRTGLGINFLSLYSYYLSSPLNLFILLFSKEKLNMAVNILLVMKIALSGLNAGIYFASKTKKRDWSILIVSIAYALNSYMVGYSWNVMWLDAIMIFPIIMLGMDCLIEKRDGRLYCLALFYALYCNYYIAFMICIFCVLWYLVHSFKDVGSFFERGFAFAFWSFLAAGLSAVILIPAYMGIKATSSGNEMGLPDHAWLTSFWNLINRQYDLCSPISHDNFDGNINLYFGLFTIVCLFLYLLNKEITFADKIKRVGLLLFFYLSFNEYILNFIWHGFHDQYGIPNRFSFLFGFVTLSICFDLLMHRRAIEIWHIGVSGGSTIGLMALCRTFATNGIDDELYLLALLLILLYLILLFLLSYDKAHRRYYYAAFALAAMVEIICTVFNGEMNVGQIEVGNYFYGTEDMEAAQKAAREDSSELFYRSELASGKIVDESSWYNLNAISLFGSTAMSKTVDIMDAMGFFTGCNEYLYEGANPVTNQMLGVKYLYYHEDDTLETDFEYKESFGSFDVYENVGKKLSLGYAIDSYIDNWSYDSAYPFIVCNDFCYQGYDYDGVFRKLKVEEPLVHGCTVHKTNGGETEAEYRFHYQTKERDNIMFVLPKQKKKTDFYLFYDGTQVEKVSITVNGEERCSGSLEGTMQLLKDVPAEATVIVMMELKGESSMGFIRFSAATLNPKIYQRFSTRMSERAMLIQEMSDTKIRGSIYTDANQYLFLSIPYDKGWTAYVDGQKTDTFAIGEAFLAINPGEGNHDILLEYTPPGFSLGWKISLGSLLLLCLLFGLTPSIQKRRKVRDDMEAARMLAYQKVCAPDENVFESDMAGKEDSDGEDRIFESLESEEERSEETGSEEEESEETGSEKEGSEETESEEEESEETGSEKERPEETGSEDGKSIETRESSDTIEECYNAINCDK